MILTPVNNRFLNHTNPIMTAALTDGGSVLDREYIQRAARGIVDAGHLSNLKFWGCAGLAKLRNSGGVDYVPKLYDLSGEGNDGVQTTEANQPVWGATGLICNNDFIDSFGWFSLADITSGTMSFWVYINNLPAASEHMVSARDGSTTNTRCWVSVFSTGELRWVLADRNVASGVFVSAGEWIKIDMTWGSGTYKGYVNGEEEYSKTMTIAAGSGDKYLSICRYPYNGSSQFDGILNDIRIYNTALTATEIAAIYNQTSYRYA